MQKELKQDFTRRLSHCNKGQMIVIMYEIYFAYAEDARLAYEAKDHSQFKEALHKAQKTLWTMIGALNFNYEISKNLHSLYIYAQKELSRTLYENSLDGLVAAEKVLKPLYRSFMEAAKQDTSGPLMQNVEQVYAGMTYGRNHLVENMSEASMNRGFLV